MRRPVVVTGIGVTVGEALGKEAFAKMCFAGQSNIKECSAFDTKGLSTSFFGETSNLPHGDGTSNERFFALMEHSIKQMMSDASLTKEDISGFGTRCRMFLGTLIFSADAFYHHSLAKRAQKVDHFIAHMNEFTTYGKELLGLKGSAAVISSSCASGTTAAGMALDYIRNGIIDCAVVGGVDSLSIVTAYGFNALKSLSSGVANPFDVSRDGINIGECGAMFFFESLEHAKARGAKIQGEIVGYALSNDAYHITSPRPDGEGAYRTMKGALKDASIEPHDIGLVDAHGTGTLANDSMEAKALTHLFKDVARDVDVSSTKALVGHAMGASGAVELAAVLLALQQQTYIPLPRLKESILVADNLHLSSKSHPLQADYALKNSFAFSGNSASLVVRRYEEVAP
jgi:3-oxoacyl-[acyl-carrier-protein] synthase II